jgi:hypothetical protein
MPGSANNKPSHRRLRRLLAATAVTTPRNDHPSPKICQESPSDNPTLPT